MLARVHTFSIDGLDTLPVTVEVDIRRGLPAFLIVGLGDAAVREARERVRAAIVNAGLEFPLRRIVANLAPAHVRKNGSSFDLPIACGVLAASGQLPHEPLAELAVYGELSLSAELRGCRGTLAVAEATRRAGLRRLLVARERASEAALVRDLDVAGLDRLAQVGDLLRGEYVESEPAAPSHPADAPAPDPPPDLDLRDVRGQAEAIEAVRVAAAGGHNLLLAGPPGTGKTMLARRLPSILPPMTRAEAIEVTRIHSVAGEHAAGSLIARRPFRAPHHTISASGLVGGGPSPVPGEASMAHHGVLFLDELAEFSRLALESLRQPVEDGRIAIVRGQQTALFPTRFMLVGATNPCPCGFAGDDSGRCRCTEADRARHERRLSGPLIDRIDVLAHVRRPAPEALRARPVTDSATVRDAVLAARERQVARLEGSGAVCNAQMDAALVRRHVGLDDEGERMLRVAYGRTLLSARGHERVLKVARTLADLDGCERVGAQHVGHALTLRRADAQHEVAA